MKIITLVENMATNNYKSTHGLSFYIETNKHKILFDLGPDDTFLINAKKKNIDIKDIDIVIISHGHYDHGGGLRTFININNKAKIYIQEKAFNNYYSIVDGVKNYIGLDKDIKNNENIILINGDYKIDDELYLFVAEYGYDFRSEANDTLFNEYDKDIFNHEQNLLINNNVLLMGCGHAGVINILNKLERKPNYCIGGFHVYNPRLQTTVSKEQLDYLNDKLDAYENIKFYTCHCTGLEAYEYLSNKHPNIKYIKCGEQLICENNF